jgi:hypothetical protein
MSTLTPKGLAAVEQFAARWVFDDEASAEIQRDLAQHIEAAIADFKATQVQDLVARTLRRALQERIVAAIDSWYRSYDYAQPVPQETKENAA